jgi:hypothetical protein
MGAGEQVTKVPAPTVRSPALQPGDFCRQLSLALDASEGRSKRRKRDQTPDTLGLTIKRSLLQRAVVDDPPVETFERWLMERIQADPAGGGARAMCGEILAEYRLAASDPAFRSWLESGAPSADNDEPHPVAPDATGVRRADAPLPGRGAGSRRGDASDHRRKGGD